MKIVDRTKDVIKSGGEWISSVDLENALMAHDAIFGCCCNSPSAVARATSCLRCSKEK